MERQTASIVKYSDSIGAQNIFPPKFFFTKIMQMDEEDAQQIIAEVEAYVEEENQRIEEERELLRKQAEERAAQSQGQTGTE